MSNELKKKRADGPAWTDTAETADGKAAAGTESGTGSEVDWEYFETHRQPAPEEPPIVPEAPPFPLKAYAGHAPADAPATETFSVYADTVRDARGKAGAGKPGAKKAAETAGGKAAAGTESGTGAEVDWEYFETHRQPAPEEPPIVPEAPPFPLKAYAGHAPAGEPIVVEAETVRDARGKAGAGKPGAKKAANRVPVRVPRGRPSEDPNLFISVNGRNWLLPRGEVSMVPPEVAEEYERSCVELDRFYDEMERREEAYRQARRMMMDY